jgi:hypothetical protein
MSRGSRYVVTAVLGLAALAPATTKAQAPDENAVAIAVANASGDGQARAIAIAIAQGGATSAVDFYAPNFGIYYRLVPFGDGSSGAVITRAPLPYAAVSSIRLEVGDMILSADNLNFASPADLLRHHYQTPIRFINVRNGRVQCAWLYLP